MDTAYRSEMFCRQTFRGSRQWRCGVHCGFIHGAVVIPLLQCSNGAPSRSACQGRPSYSRTIGACCGTARTPISSAATPTPGKSCRWLSTHVPWMSLPLAKPFSCETTAMNRICAVVSANSVAATAIGIPSGKQLWSLPSSARPDSSYSCVVHVFDGVVYLAQSSFSTVLSRISREGNVVWNVSVPYSYYIEDIVAVDATHLVTAGVDCIDVSTGVVVWSYGMTSIRPTTNFYLTKDARDTNLRHRVWRESSSLIGSSRTQRTNSPKSCFWRTLTIAILALSAAPL